MEIITNKTGQPPGTLNNFLLTMHLITILILAGILQVSATTNAQKLTLVKDAVTIKQVFKAIKVQTGFDVLWQPPVLNADRQIKAHFIRTELTDVIKECLLGTDLAFEIQNESIILRSPISVKDRASQQDSIIYKGRITDEEGRPLGGATVKVAGSSKSTFTSSSGNFAIYGPRKGTLEITYIGYLVKQLTLNGLDVRELIAIKMIPGNNNLGEVNIISTGYQEIAKERATGSFEVITKEQLQHSSDPNLIKRLEGITTSMNFNNQLIPINSANTTVALTDPNKSPLANLTIRGKNTLNSTLISYSNQSGAVLVVIDGIASPYSIDNVNPNEVESMTVLKDAAAASVWGARAANGVIVVTTKRGKYNRPLNISLNNNFNVKEKIDLFYPKVMGTSEYIDAQRFQFNSAKTQVISPTVGSAPPLLSPVAEILGQLQTGIISEAQAEAQLDALRNNDLRKDFDKYLLRNSLNQSYSLGIDGGGQRSAYRVFGGYDKSLDNSQDASFDRLSLSYSSLFKPLKNLDITVGVNYTVRNTYNQATQDRISIKLGNPFYPYSRIADENGNGLSVPYKYRPAFINLLANTYGNKIQDLIYTPLNNVNLGYYKTKFKSLNLNFGVNYKLSNDLTVNVMYAHGLGDNNIASLNGKESFYMRDLITYYTSPAGVQSIPNGSLYTGSIGNTTFNSLRGQISLNKQWRRRHVINAIAGMEATQSYFLSKPFQYYGYNEKTLVSINQIDFKDNVATLYDPGLSGTMARIPTISTSPSDGRVRTYSAYSNLAYTYINRYTLSGSFRNDMSSDFGYGTNKKGAPFFSVGGKWNIAEEDFYKVDLLPILSLRATFGYNGNVNPAIVGRQIVSYSGGVTQINELSYATALSNSVTNEKLRPEKTGVFNLGVDFGLKNGRVTGSFEYYNKKTTDLIASNSIDPSTGFSSLQLNTSKLQGWGNDFNLTTKNLQVGKLSWESSLLLSYNRVKVNKLYSAAARIASDGLNTGLGYNEGADLSRLYGYRWAGLDPSTGDPRGFVNGVPVKINTNTYAGVSRQPLSSLHYFGSAVPVYFGSIRNTIRYGAFSLSANILLKAGYYFRRPGADVVSYSSLFGSNGYNVVQGIEFSNRWQNPSDELKTNVPSQNYPGDISRDFFYYYSEINIQKADHLRLQEINFSYSLSKKGWHLKNPTLYANISNLGIIWRANKLGLDPDIADYPNPRSYSFGISANF